MKQQRRAAQRGAALVEFALVSALLFLLLFGIIEVGLLLGDQAQVGAAAREAARSASVGSTVETAQAGGVSAGTGIHLTAASVSLEKSLDNGSTWTYNHPLVTTLIFSGSAKLLTSKLVMQRE